MAGKPTTGTGGRPRSIPTPDELVVHLREAGARSVYVSREGSFRDDSIQITATYEYASDEPDHGSSSETVHELLTSVFDAFGDRIWFHDREWVLDWSVEPAFPESRPDLVPIYDRRVERKHGDGFNLWNLNYVYEDVRE